MVRNKDHCQPWWQVIKSRSVHEHKLCLGWGLQSAPDVVLAHWLCTDSPPRTGCTPQCHLTVPGRQAVPAPHLRLARRLVYQHVRSIRGRRPLLLYFWPSLCSFCPLIWRPSGPRCRPATSLQVGVTSLRWPTSDFAGQTKKGEA